MDSLLEQALAGYASGHSFEEDEEMHGIFRWSAFGPGGSRRGVATSSAAASRAAKAAEEELSRLSPGQPPLTV